MIALPESPQEFFFRELAQLSKDNQAFKAALFLASEIHVFDLATSYCEQSLVPPDYTKALQAHIQNSSKLSFEGYKSLAEKLVENYSEAEAQNVITGFALFLADYRELFLQMYEVYGLSEVGESLPLPPSNGLPLSTAHHKYNKATLPSPAKFLINTLMLNKDMENVLGSDCKYRYLESVSADPERVNQDAVDGEVKQKLFRYIQFPPRADMQEYARELDEAFPNIKKGK